MSSVVVPSIHFPSNCMAGAPPQAARHSTRRTVYLPSGVVCPSWMPSFAHACSTRASAPLSAHEMFVQISIWCCPSGWNRYIV
jgi:hypothetical protein